jgi:polyhydroxyalkanoate synthesis regulator phasin
MADDRGFLNRLRSRGEEVLTQVSAELSQNPRFMRAMAGAMKGKEKLEEAVARVLRQMNVPSRSELKKAIARIDALEREIASLRAKSKAKAAGGPKRAPKRGSARGKASA